METVCERIHDLRESNNMTQAQVGAILGVTQQIYSNYELNKREIPIRHLLSLANLYDVSTDYILGRITQPKILPDLSRNFIQQVTIGDFVGKITSFSPKSKTQLVDYVNFLTYLENKKKK